MLNGLNSGKNVSHKEQVASEYITMYKDVNEE